MEEVVKKRMISLPEVKEILSKVNPESMDQIQRWTHDYVSKFSKIEPSAAKKMKQELISQCGFSQKH
jgi:DNA-directed RNA polymerase subunit F